MSFRSRDNEGQERVYYVRAHPDFVTDSDVFAVARSSFAWLVTGPDPISVDGREIPGLPPQPVPLDELGTLLLAGDCDQVTRDAAWAYLITRARTEGGTWTVACVGLALPVLLRVAAIVTRRFTGDTHDLNAAVVTGFLAELREVDLVRPAILARLYYAAYRAGRLALHEAVGGPIPVADVGFDSAPPPRPEGHPDLVLAAAVRVGAITADEAGLISETRVGETSLAEAAQARGMSYKATAKMRERAEPRLAAYLTELSADSPAIAPGDRPGSPNPPRARRAHASRRRTEQTTGRHRTRLRNVTRAAAVAEKKGRRAVSQNDPKSRIASRGIRLPADRRSRARRTSSGPGAHTSREVRSCD
ncbi:sigma-70 family RNA polymerase sigma factor [Amycolatopsis palatopharyngis]|uniref:sigma-70 family RNA polymerase sigma factor n=1 Tax=Amycolatopsis palatopharyngis TaxID=187982 RepID=UPI000E2310DA|nr:sigma-70 family RNA polymerase sigma factor [Amycolatopsis palatopharyngis]